MKLAVSQLCFVTKYSKPLLLRLYMFYMYECSLQNLPKWGRRQVRMVCGWLYTYIVPDAFITLTRFLNTLLVYFLNAYLKHLSQSWTFTQVSNFFFYSPVDSQLPSFLLYLQKSMPSQIYCCSISHFPWAVFRKNDSNCQNNAQDGVHYTCMGVLIRILNPTLRLL